MKYIFIITTVLVLTNNLFAQKKTKLNFQISKFDVNEKFFETKSVIIDKVDTLNLDFYCKNFNLPNKFRLKLFSSKFKNEIITKTFNINIENDSIHYPKNANQSNPYDIYKFDKKGRLTDFIRESCFTCNWEYYKIKIIYNDNEQTAIMYKVNFLKNETDYSDYLKIYFNKKNIFKLEKYRSKKLIETIELSNNI